MSGTESLQTSRSLVGGRKVHLTRKFNYLPQVDISIPRCDTYLTERTECPGRNVFVARALQDAGVGI